MSRLPFAPPLDVVLLVLQLCGNRRLSTAGSVPCKTRSFISSKRARMVSRLSRGHAPRVASRA
ncbi:hypothetical protein [Paraburkholderia phenoliruptrix]|uniref:hypothetical protein n=1 Tax=Paraburkholderia phenoliruptrix TaxID=252970 RepID=UPI0005A22C8D|nr:hypothetical protein [Paraburkholderia phenoliruptrix]